jgi:hypothetical protein
VQQNIALHLGSAEHVLEVLLESLAPEGKLRSCEASAVAAELASVAIEGQDRTSLGVERDASTNNQHIREERHPQKSCGVSESEYRHH